jgi:hypothetical protein
MNIFAPYQVLEHTEKHIHLALPTWRKRVQFFFFRIFPFVLFGLLVPVILNAKDMPMGLLYLFILTTMAVSLILLFKKYPVEVDITSTSIQLIQKTFAGTKQQTLLVNDIEELSCKIRHGKYGGTFFKVKLKTGEKLEVITIPVIIMKRENTDQIISVIEQITGLKTIMDLPFYSRK